MAVDLDMGKMIGPLPLGAWIAVVGGGLGLMVYTRGQSAAAPERELSPEEMPEDISGVPGVGTGATGGWAYQPPAPAESNTAPAPADNESWARMVVNSLIAMSYDPAVADSAMRKYLEGASLSASEYAMVRIGLAKHGAPPVLLPAPVFAPPTLPTVARPSTTVSTPTAGKPKTVSKPKAVSKPKKRYYTVRRGDTLSKIARKYNMSWQRIYNANKGKIKNPNSIRVGQKLLIPN